MEAEASTSSEFPLEDFVDLPWHLQKAIVSELSASDLIHFSRAHPHFEQLVNDRHKCWDHINLDGDLRVERTLPSGRIQRRLWEYQSGDFHPLRQRDITKRQTTPTMTVVFCKGNETARDEDAAVVLRNATVKQLNFLRDTHLAPGLRVGFLHRPGFDTIDELQSVIGKLKCTGLGIYSLTLQGSTTDAALIDFFLRNPQLTTISYDVAGQSYLHLLSQLYQPKQWLKIHGHTNGVHDVLFSITDTIIRQWEAKEREIDAWMVCLANGSEWGDDEFENVLNFELNEMARRLSYGSLGCFEKRDDIDPRFRLIRREDGTGLLIMTGGLSIILISCDYQLRRARGLGNGSKIREFYNALSTLMYPLRAAETQIWQLEKFGRPPKKPEAKEVVDQDVFAIFGDLEVGREVDAEETEEQPEVPERDLKMEALLVDRQKARDAVETAIREHLAEFGKLSDRELAIDTLFLGGDEVPQINRYLLDHLFNNGFEPEGYPSKYYFAEWHMRIGHELVGYYKKHGVIPNYFC
ncbi:unnamed protein product, partial [Mesorhabditis spiculigera]